MTTQFLQKWVTVMGLGAFGGGAGVTRWLAGQGAKVLVTDLRPEQKLASAIEPIRDLIENGQVTLRLGEHVEDDFRTADVVIANPAVPRPWENPYLLAARDAGAMVTTEIRLVVERLNRSRVIGVTGSAGKSTTAAMIHHVLDRAGTRSHFGGNIGGSLLNRLDDIRPDDWIVLELSSAMLYWLGESVRPGNAPCRGAQASRPQHLETGLTGQRQNSVGAPPRAHAPAPQRPARRGAWGDALSGGWSPHIAVLTNLEPNHLDWHGTLEHYRNCKEQIFFDQLGGDHAIIGDMTDPLDCVIPLLIRGAHNVKNATAALHAASHALGEAPEDLVPLLEDFRGLPHRLQYIGEFNGYRAFNDSKSTMPHATVLAVDAFDDPSRIHLISGGYDKGSDLSPIAHLADSLAGLYTIGATGPTLARAAQVRSSDSRVVQCDTLERAIDSAVQRMAEGDILLLSPGCASWDQFSNYEQRGERFIELVRILAGAVV